MSLRAKLLLLWVGLAVTPLLVIGVFEYYYSAHSLRTLIASQVAAISQRAAAEVADGYARRVSDLLLVAENAETQRLYDAYAAGDEGELANARQAAEAYLDQAWELFGSSYHWMELRDSADIPLLRFGLQDEGAWEESFRGHGRTWWTRLPWGWGLSDRGPLEHNTPPLESEMNNPAIEPIAKHYAELRYQLLSHAYTLAWEARDTGMPMMRAMWLHYPDDERARGLGDQYLWGRDLLVAPVYEPDASSRDVYLPAGEWYDWWSNGMETGGGTITREVDLATMPIYVRAGAIVPFDPVRQYVDQPVGEPLTLRIYRGADGTYTLYDDDGISLDYLDGGGELTRITWDDSEGTLAIEPADGTTSTVDRTFRIELLPDGVTGTVTYSGRRVEVAF